MSEVSLNKRRSRFTLILHKALATGRYPLQSGLGIRLGAFYGLLNNLMNNINNYLNLCFHD